MKLIKTKYDLTLNEVSIMFETEDRRILCRLRWVPAVVLNRYYARFMFKFSEMFNASEVMQLIDQDLMRARIINRVNNILYPLYMGLLLSDREEFKQAYQDTFGMAYNSRDDLKMIIREMERLKGKIREMGTPEQNVQGKGKTSFEEIITYVEAILDRSIDREMRLFQFKHQYDLAVKRAKEYEKMKK